MKRRKRESSTSNSNDCPSPGNKVARKRGRYGCSFDGCTNIAVKGGVCIRHGAKKKLCSREGCTNIAKKGGVCTRHGAKIKRCSRKGCTNYALKGGVCIRHGAKKKLCSSEGCTNNAKKGGVCQRHGAEFQTLKFVVMDVQTILRKKEFVIGV